MKAWIAASALALEMVALDARADLPGPKDYAIAEEPVGTVQVTLVSHGTPTCPASGLLRKDVRSGEVVRITLCEAGTFTDECVPAGTYQYGLAKPYACDGRDAFYYRQVTVAGSMDLCVRSGSPPAPADGVPWEGRGPMVCGDAGGSGGGCGTARAGVLGTNLAVLLAGLALWRWRAGRRRRR